MCKNHALKQPAAISGTIQNSQDRATIIETFERMKRFAANVPVIFLTASGLEQDVVSAIKLGAVNYLKKPYQPQELLKRVAQEFERS